MSEHINDQECATCAAHETIGDPCVTCAGHEFVAVRGGDAKRYRMRFHYHHQQWLSDHRRWQRFHLFWPNGRRWRGVGIVVWCHEFSLRAEDGGRQ